MRTELYWIAAPSPGRLAIMPRPRGGDWLEEEIQAWRRSGVDLVVSLLAIDEQIDLDLLDEKALCDENDIEFISFSIVDRSVPSSMSDFSKLISRLADGLANGKNIAVHCRQGIGRAGLVAICLLIYAGMDQEAALVSVKSARGCPVPETSDQRRWITDFATSLAVGVAK